jgi:hypothetical protein
MRRVWGRVPRFYRAMPVKQSVKARFDFAATAKREAHRQAEAKVQHP